MEGRHGWIPSCEPEGSSACHLPCEHHGVKVYNSVHPSIAHHAAICKWRAHLKACPVHAAVSEATRVQNLRSLGGDTTLTYTCQYPHTCTRTHLHIEEDMCSSILAMLCETSYMTCMSKSSGVVEKALAKVYECPDHQRERDRYMIQLEHIRHG